MIKIGFIGFGRFSQTRVKVLATVPGVSVVGYFDPGVHQGEGVIRRFEDANELLGNIDAVIISVPPKLAPSYVAQSLRSNLHVFCEKPAAVSTSDLMQIEAHISEEKVLAYGFNHRQHSSIRKMKALIKERVLGNILWMRGRYGKEVDDSYRNTWRCNVDLNGGGILIDQGIHMVDLMTYLANGFDGAQAVLSTSYLNKPGIDDNGFINLYSTTSKISASIHSTITQWRYMFSLEIFLEKGSLILNGLKTNSGNYGDEILTIKPNENHQDIMDISELHYEVNESWKEEMESFIVAIKNGTEYPYAKYEDALQTTKLIDLIYKGAVWL